MEWRPAGWSVCLRLLIFPCTIKSRSSLLAPAHPGCHGNTAVKRLWLWCGGLSTCLCVHPSVSISLPACQAVSVYLSIRPCLSIHISLSLCLSVSAVHNPPAYCQRHTFCLMRFLYWNYKISFEAGVYRPSVLLSSNGHCQNTFMNSQHCHQASSFWIHLLP